VLTLGRGSSARTIADLAGIGAADVVVDVGCGTGTAARLAARRGPRVVGVDPSGWKLRLARAITSVRRTAGISFLPGRAESLPLADASATVVWSMSAVHHWDDRARGVSEARRVLAPGGRLLLADHRVKPGGRGLAAHGLTPDGEDQLLGHVKASGFVDATAQTRGTGAGAWVLVSGVVPGPG
jgi:ubiquinone/menaquinone biosynthesis C-methylase UbiE